MTKIIVRSQNHKTITEYESRLIPMMGDDIDLPHQLGIVRVIERIFFVDNPDEIIIIVKR